MSTAGLTQRAEVIAPPLTRYQETTPIAKYGAITPTSPRALERHKKEEATIIPVIVRDVNWKKAPFAKFQALPKDGKAVKLWKDTDSAWRNVSEGLEKVVEEYRKRS